MSRICPNCHYARKASDSAPDWQCPACEIAYNKGAGAAADANYGRPVVPPPAKSPSGSGSGKWLLILAVLAAGFWLGKPVWQGKAGACACATAGKPRLRAIKQAKANRRALSMSGLDWA